MLYCKKCGSELKGAKNYCIICGAKQDQIKREQKVVSGKTDTQTQKPGLDKKPKKKGEETGKCIRCGDETEKKCFFCEEFICRDHFTKMQANLHPYDKWVTLKANGETKRINEGWRGFIIFSCPKCTGRKNTKPLTNGELDAVNLVNQCSWYKLDR